MKHAILAATLALGLGLAVRADARPVTFDVAMANYSGRQAYWVAYVVDSKGSYVSTLYAAGGSGRFFEHLDRWWRMFTRAHRPVDGSTGASMGAGSRTSFMVEVPDKMLNAGFTLRIESAVEGQYYVPDEAAVPLDDAHNGAATAGKSYLQTLTVSF